MRSTMMRRVIAIAVLAVLLVLAISAGAFAATPANQGTGQSYGTHVSGCATVGMLGVDCNPGMHQGISGWKCPGV